MTDGTAIPTPAEWPALRLAWALGTIAAADLARAAGPMVNAHMLLGRMARRGLLQRAAPGRYVAQHSRETIISVVMGEV